jgi:hypothetical protein
MATRYVYGFNRDAVSLTSTANPARSADERSIITGEGRGTKHLRALGGVRLDESGATF